MRCSLPGPASILARHHLSACLAAVGFVSFFAAGPAFALDLVQAYQAALQHDPVYRAAQGARDAGLEERNLGRSLLLPRISASVSDGRTRVNTRETEVLSGSGSILNSSTTETRSSLQTESTTKQLGQTRDSNSSTERTVKETSASEGSLDNRTNESTREYARGTRASASLQLRQPLIDFGALAGYRQGVAASEAAQADFLAREQELMVRVAEAYAEVLFQIDNLTLARTQLETLRLQESSNERLLKGGQGTITDVLETRAKREVAQAQVIEAEDNLAVARSRLSFMTGLQVNDVAPLRTELATQPQDVQMLEHWRNLAQERNQRLQSLARQVTVAREEARKADSGHLPRLELVASISEDRLRSRPSIDTANSSSNTRDTRFESVSDTEDNTRVEGGSSNPIESTSNVRSDGTSLSSSASATSLLENGFRTNRSSDRYIGLQLTIPIFEGGATSARARQAAARLVQAQAEFDGLRDQIFQDLNQQHRLVQSFSQRAQALMQAVESSRVGVEATAKSMAAGFRTNLDVLNARERLIAAERELASARYNYLLAFLRLRFNAGVLAPEDLALVSVREPQN